MTYSLLDIISGSIYVVLTPCLFFFFFPMYTLYTFFGEGILTTVGEGWDFMHLGQPVLIMERYI